MKQLIKSLLLIYEIAYKQREAAINDDFNRITNKNSN